MDDVFERRLPKPEELSAMTEESLRAAFAGESQAAEKYLVFAEQAEEDGYPHIAKLFRAISFAETRHARNHLRVLGGVGTTAENLEAAFGGETFEIDEMYPAYNAVAKLQENKSAQTTIRYALKAEMDHQGIYDSTLKGVEGKKDLGVESVRVCPICGHTVIGDAPDECPQCGTAAVYFKEF